VPTIIVEVKKKIRMQVHLLMQHFLRLHPPHSVWKRTRVGPIDSNCLSDDEVLHDAALSCYGAKPEQTTAVPVFD